MSGIVGIINFDGVPVDHALLCEMTDSLAFRGPDARNIHVEQASGFGHTLLRTTYESAHEHQPLTLGGEVWIVADARIDARCELIANLSSRGQDIRPEAPDVELILRAYLVWGEECVQHLLGDFAFGIWDAARRRLFCARDHLGVRLLYYANRGSGVVFSNTLDCIRKHPGISNRLNDLAVADFLLFDRNQESGTTIFEEIRQLSPAHYAVWSAEGLQVRRYWSLPIDEPIYYRRHDDYVDRFQELLRTAVGDRLRTDRIAVFMSGGLDSPTLAATARDLLRQRGGDDGGIRAFTTSYTGYDEERHYASLVAQHLGISIEFQDWSDDMAPADWCQTHFHTPEPTPYPNFLASRWSQCAEVSAFARVAFFGEGPDTALLYEWRPYLSYLFHRRRIRQLASEITRHAIAHRRVPLLTSLPRILLRRSPTSTYNAVFPDWFNVTVERRLGLRERWEQSQFAPPYPHSIRPIGYNSFHLPVWQSIFESWDAGHTRCTLEVRHPFLDVRLLRYMLGIPALPWCRAKYLLRKAMRDILPLPVITRPKSPLVRDLWPERVRQQGLSALIPAPRLSEYLNVERLRREPSDTNHFWADFRTRALNYWLTNLDDLGRDKQEIEQYERIRQTTYR